MSMREAVAVAGPLAGFVADRIDRLRDWWSARPPALIPHASLAGHALVAVVAIMTLLSCLTIGAASLVRETAQGWANAVGQQATIHVRAVPGRDIEADLAALVTLARATAGVTGARIVPAAETRRLVEPWLGGTGDLPVPRMIEVSRGSALDGPALQAVLQRAVPGTRFDDHGAWTARLSATARGTVSAALAVVALMLAATALAVMFAATAAVAQARPVVEVLSLSGASADFIAYEFQKHMLALATAGAAIGAGLAVLFFVGLALMTGPASLTPLFGSFIVSLPGYAGMAGLMVLAVSLSALAARLAVTRALEEDD